MDAGCKQGGGPSDLPGPDPQPKPVYRLSDGHSLYDDFDGHGCLQTFDGASLAEPGRLSSRIWQAWTGYGTADIVPSPVESGLLAVVDENGQRVEYGREDRAVEEVVSYLVERPRPATAFERSVLEGLLNERGRAASAGLEARPLDEQVQVIRYLLDNGSGLFNERGRTLAEALDREDAISLASGGWRRLARKGFDEAELLVVSRLAAEAKMYEAYREAARRGARGPGGAVVRTGVRRRVERQEIEYVFDARGRLLRAAPRVPGRPYASARTLLWTGVRNGLYPSRNGEGRIRAGRVYATAEVAAAAGRDNVLRMSNSLLTGMSCHCSWPDEIEFADLKSFSADVLLSSQTTSRSFYAVLDYHTTIPEQTPGKSWALQIGAGTVGGGGTLKIIGQCVNVNTGYRFFKRLGEARLDRWYNLRCDVVTRADDATVPEGQFRIDFFVDGVLLGSEVPEDAALLLDPARTGAGPRRILSVDNGEEGKTSVGFFDNVRAVYKDRIA
jgi:hypothetical protein